MDSDSIGMEVTVRVPTSVSSAKDARVLADAFSDVGELYEAGIISGPTSVISIARAIAEQVDEVVAEREDEVVALREDGDGDDPPNDVCEFIGARLWNRSADYDEIEAARHLVLGDRTVDWSKLRRYVAECGETMGDLYECANTWLAAPLTMLTWEQYERASRTPGSNSKPGYVPTFALACAVGMSIARILTDDPSPRHYAGQWEVGDMEASAHDLLRETVSAG